MRVYPGDSVQLLEFDKVCASVRHHCQSDIGRKQVDEIRFHTDLEILQHLLQQVQEFNDILDRKLSFPSQGFISLQEEIDKLGIENYVLTPIQFSKLRSALNATRKVYNFFKQNEEEFDSLRMIVQSSVYDPRFLEMINQVVDDFDQVRSNASPELLKIRNEINRKQVEQEKVFRRILDTYKKQGILAETVESVRSGRRVLSVLSEHKRQVNGVTQDESDSGKIAYIEPEVCVQINNDLLGLDRKEKREIYRILNELTNQIAQGKGQLDDYQQILGSLDFIRAKALYAKEIDAHKPQLRTQPHIRLIDARNPILFQMNKKNGSPTIPLHVQLDRDQRILVISGPNAGGKSVSLKTIGLCQMMLQAGMLIPADDQSEIGIFRQLFTDIGDAQSIEDELSTYSSRLKRMRYFLEKGNDRTLFLIDEFGSGTDPQLGGAVAEAILDDLNDRNCFGVVTTHYANLKVYADHHEHVSNGSMIYDERKLKPTYRLEVGKPGSSYTFAIASQSGLPKKVIYAAKELVDNKSIEFENLLQQVRLDKQNLEESMQKVQGEDQRLKQLMKKFEKLNAEIEGQQKKLKLERKQEQKEMLRKVEERVNQIIQDVKGSVRKEEKARDIKRQLVEESTNLHEDVKQLKKSLDVNKLEGKIEEGSSVRLIESEKVGKVAQIRRNKALVTFGNIQTQVKLNDLVLVNDEVRREKPSVFKSTVSERAFVPSEIDLRGKTQKEAIEELEMYLDSVFLQDLSEIRIVHGKGTGALRRAVWKCLDGFSEVQEMYHPADEFGGDGVTIAKLV